MTIKVIKINIDGTAETHEVEPNFQAYYPLLDGGFIEPISDGSDWTGYLDEEGKIKGLPLNDTADFVARALGWRGDVSDRLVGPVVFLGGVDENGTDTSVTDEVAELIERFTPGGEIREPDQIRVEDRSHVYRWIGEREARDPEDRYGHDSSFIVDLSVSHNKGRKLFEAHVSTARMEYNDRGDGTEYVMICHRMGLGRTGPDCDTFTTVDVWATPRYNAKMLGELSVKCLDQLRAGEYDEFIRADALGELHRVPAAVSV